jgi:predicted Zn-dependent peptidase
VTTQRTRLDSGIEVVTEHVPGVRSAALGMWVGVGSRDEAEHEHGCSHFLEHLLFKGTERRSARRIAEELDAVGGEMNAFTSREVTCFYARVLDRDLPLAVDVLGDMMVAARNTPADVEAERQVVLSEIDIHLDSPDDLAHADAMTLALGDHPLALETLGTEDEIASMHRDTIHEYYLRCYRPENLTVVAAGNVEHDAVVALVDDHVGDLGRPGGQRPSRTAPPAPAPGAVQVRHRPTEQVHVVLGGRGVSAADPRRHALRVATTVLGGGMSSRLFQEVREERGLAYTTYAYLSGYVDAGVLFAYAGTTPGKVDEVLDVLGRELDTLAETITEEEVERAKGAMTGGMVLGLEDPGSRMSRIGRILTSGNELVDIDTALARVEAVTVDDVRRVTAEVLAGPRSLAVVGPFAPEESSRFERHVR